MYVPLIYKSDHCRMESLFELVPFLYEFIDTAKLLHFWPFLVSNSERLKLIFKFSSHINWQGIIKSFDFLVTKYSIILHLRTLNYTTNFQRGGGHLTDFYNICTMSECDLPFLFHRD